MTIGYLYLAATIGLSVYSQIVIKWRVSTCFPGLGEIGDLWGKILLIARILFDPFVFSGLLATFISGICWMMTMSKFDVSYAYPFTSIGFVLVMGLSWLILGEPLGLAKIAGTILIVLGVVVASRGF